MQRQDAVAAPQRANALRSEAIAKSGAALIPIRQSHHRPWEPSFDAVNSDDSTRSNEDPHSTDPCQRAVLPYFDGERTLSQKAENLPPFCKRKEDS